MGRALARDRKAASSTPGLSATELQLWASCSHPCASVTKQYNLVPAKGRRRSATGTVGLTVGLASRWPCVTDSVVYPPTGSMALKGR